MTPEDEEFNRIEMESKVRQEHITQSGWRKRLTQEQSRYCLNCETLSKQVADLEDRIKTIYKQLDEQERANQEQKRPQNCGTSYCSCIDCVMDKQEQGEPVAYMYPDDLERMQTSESFCNVFSVKVGSPDKGLSTVELYTTPQQRTWVGLTDREKSNLWLESRAAIPRFHTYASLVEAKLKEKNTQ
jgi:hypothetical protein